MCSLAKVLFSSHFIYQNCALRLQSYLSLAKRKKMKKKIVIYLAGSIKKGHEKADESFWTDQDMNQLRHCLPQFEISFLNPAFRSDDLSDQFSVFGRDMLQVFCSDIVFVDARDRRGLGVGAEMMWAKFHKIPLVVWAPKNSHYHKNHATILGVPVSNFVHPFVESLSDKLVETVEEGAHWIKALLLESLKIEIKGIKHIEAAMDHYKASQLANDKPMQDLLHACGELQQRVKLKPMVEVEI